MPERGKSGIATVSRTYIRKREGLGKLTQSGRGPLDGQNAFGLGATALLYDSRDYAVMFNAGAGMGLQTNVAGVRAAVALQW